MKKIFYVLLVSCIGLTIIISCSSSSDEDDIEEIMTTDTTAATLAEVTAVVLLQMELEKSISRVSHFLIVQLRCNFNRIFT